MDKMLHYNNDPFTRNNSSVLFCSESDYLYVYYYEYINHISVSSLGYFFRQFATSAHVKIVNGYPATASSDIRQIE